MPRGINYSIVTITFVAAAAAAAQLLVDSRQTGRYRTFNGTNRTEQNSMLFVTLITYLTWISPVVVPVQ